MGGNAMPTFIMLTRLNPDAVLSPRGLEQLEREAMKRDVFKAKDIESAARVSTILRTFGHAQTEIWTATEWDRFKEIVRTLPGPG
jgi:hypothetical protein